jgi:hypothetical protein
VLADGGIRTSSQQGGTCQPARADGQPCSQDLACQSGFCDRLGSAFSSNTGLCAAACP